MRVVVSLFTAFLLTGCYLFGDVLVLDSGKTMKIKSYTVEGRSMRVQITENGEMVIPLEWIRQIRVVPNEPEPVLSAQVEAQTPAEFAFSGVVLSLAEKYEVDWKLVAAVMAVESNYNPRAISPKGAQGLMQLMPATARMYKVNDPYDPHQNLEAGVRHLKMLVNRYKGQLELALAAYNSGEEAVNRHKGIPPYAETRAYVKKVLQRIQQLST